MKIPLDSLLLYSEAPIREALNLLDRTGSGFALAIDPVGKLVGVLTDGDIRRSLLRALDLTASISLVMRKNFISLPVTASAETISATFTEQIAFVPLLDTAGCPVDVAFRQGHHRISLVEPWLAGNEEAYLVECVRTGWISSQGRFVGQFESMLTDFHDGVRALAVCNGTMALHLALIALGIGPGDEVIVPDFTFAATASAVIHAGARPVFADVNPETWTLDEASVTRVLTPRTKALIPVHLYGHPCDMDPLMELARSHGLFVVEDCAEAMGACYKGRLVGTFGHASCFSFFGNKTLTTGEGGAVLFAEETHYNKARILRDHGMDPNRRYWHLVVGYNFRMTNLQAALGVAQMERVQDIFSRKQALGQGYLRHLVDVEGLAMPPHALWADPSYWLFTLLVRETSSLTRDELAAQLAQKGIETRPVFFPLHSMPAFAGCGAEGQFPVTERLAAQGLSLPSGAAVDDGDISVVTKAMRDSLAMRRMKIQADGR